MAVRIACFRTGLSIVPALILALSVWAGAATARENAEYRVIGFSTDGRYFAFEQFGVQDGSGFPYAEIQIIDLDNDKWVAGTPIKVTIKNDSHATPAPARKSAMTKAAGLIAKLKISDPGIVLASRAVTQKDGDPYSLTFRLNPYIRPQQTATVRLKIVGQPLPKTCQDLIKETYGFALTWQVRDGPVRTLYRDKALPASRGCAMDYGLSAVISSSSLKSGQRFVVLIDLIRFGFEGPDRRFLAVPVNR
jgi:predicted secreted protein